MTESMWQNQKRLGREQTKYITAEVEGNHSNFKQKLAEKKTFFSCEKSAKNSHSGKGGLRAAVSRS